GGPGSFQTSAEVLSFGVRSLILLLTDLGAVIGVAIGSALTARSPNHASVTTVFRVLILPSLVFLAVSLVTVIPARRLVGPIPNGNSTFCFGFGSGSAPIAVHNCLDSIFPLMELPRGRNCTVSPQLMISQVPESVR